MEPFERQIDRCLEQLRMGATISFPGKAHRWAGCDATVSSAITLLLQAFPGSPLASILLGEARFIFRYLAAPDPDIAEKLESPEPVKAAAVVSLPDITDRFDTLLFRLPENVFQKALVKRLQQPMLLFPVLSASSQTFGYAAS